MGSTLTLMAMMDKSSQLVYFDIISHDGPKYGLSYEFLMGRAYLVRSSPLLLPFGGRTNYAAKTHHTCLCVFSDPWLWNSLPIE